MAKERGSVGRSGGRCATQPATIPAEDAHCAGLTDDTGAAICADSKVVLGPQGLETATRGPSTRLAYN